jgi:HPt (histidine-containing phosphotransfer) domain-containing protein
MENLEERLSDLEKAVNRLNLKLLAYRFMQRTHHNNLMRYDTQLAQQAKGAALEQARNFARNLGSSADTALAEIAAELETALR